MAKSLLEMATDIVQAQAGTKSMSAEELAGSLKGIFSTLADLQAQEAGAIAGPGSDQPVASAMTADQSIQKSKIFCLECGEEFKVLSHKHLASHGLTGDAYREKYGFKKRQPLCAKGLTASRKKAGKERGIPEALKTANAARRGGEKKGAAVPAKKAAPKKKAPKAEAEA